MELAASLVRSLLGTRASLTHAHGVRLAAIVVRTRSMVHSGGAGSRELLVTFSRLTRTGDMAPTRSLTRAHLTVLLDGYDSHKNIGTLEPLGSHSNPGAIDCIGSIADLGARAYNLASRAQLGYHSPIWFASGLCN